MDRMKITARLGAVFALVFALVCFGVAVTGYNSLEAITDPKQLADARGFAGFWAFLGVVGAFFSVLSWRMVANEPDQ